MSHSVLERTVSITYPRLVDTQVEPLWERLIDPAGRAPKHDE
jgi:hypothetical protein